jgi:hypothetical protein
METESEQIRWMPVLTLWEEPSFDDPKMWTVLVDMDANRKDDRLEFDIFGRNTPFFKAKVIQLNNARWHIPRPMNYLDRGINLTDEERAKLLTFVTTLEAPISENDFGRLRVDSFFSFMPCDLEGLMGLDGVRYGLQISAIYTSLLHLEWWSSGPKEWREITTWAADARKLLASIINEHNK